jgi:hypothetical protein
LILTIKSLQLLRSNFSSGIKVLFPTIPSPKIGMRKRELVWQLLAFLAPRFEQFWKIELVESEQLKIAGKFFMAAMQA